MRIVSIMEMGDWKTVRNVARLTQGKSPIYSEVSQAFKEKMIISRHEPLKILNYLIQIECPQWVAMHFVRHKHSVHFAQSSRNDITGVPRDPNKIIQYVVMANPVGLMDMAEKRLCRRASEETQAVMQLIVADVGKLEPLLAARLQPSCVVKGYCPEQFNPCGYNNTKEYGIKRADYLAI